MWSLLCARQPWVSNFLQYKIVGPDVFTHQSQRLSAFCYAFGDGGRFVWPIVCSKGGSLLSLLDPQQGNLSALVSQSEEVAELQQAVSAKVLVAKFSDAEQLRSRVLQHPSAVIRVFATGALPSTRCRSGFPNSD